MILVLVTAAWPQNVLTSECVSVTLDICSTPSPLPGSLKTVFKVKGKEVRSNHSASVANDPAGQVGGILA